MSIYFVTLVLQIDDEKYDFVFYKFFILSYYIVFIEKPMWKPIFVMYFFIAEFWALELVL